MAIFESRSPITKTIGLLSIFRDRILLSAVMLGFALRALYAAWVPVKPMSDPLSYDSLAINLARYGTYELMPNHPASVWPPGTSFLCSLLYRVFGHVYWPIACLNVLLGTLVVVLACWLALGWFGQRVARVTAVTLAIWPSLILYTTVIASELPFMVFTLLALTLYASRPERLWVWLAMGLTLGLACYVRTEALLLGVVIAFGRPPECSLRNRVAAATVILCTVSLAVAPWCLRNTRIYGAPTFMTTTAGANFWMGNNPGSRGGYMTTPPAEHRNSRDQDRYLSKLAMDYVLSHPGAFAVNTVVKAVRLHERETEAYVWTEPGLAQRIGPIALRLVKWIAQLYWAAVLTAGVIGAVTLFRRGWRQMLTHPAALFWAYITGLHAVTLSLQDRFHFPSNPFIAMFASVTILAVWDGWERRNKRHLASTQ